MDIEDLLTEDAKEIVAEACHAIVRLEHYRRDGADATRRRVEALYQEVVAAIRTRDVSRLRAYAAALARDRQQSGFELGELQAAFSALEAAIERDALAKLPEYDQAWGLGLACTAIAHGKHALEPASGCCAALAPETGYDLTPLFRGTAAVLRPAADMVLAV